MPILTEEFERPEAIPARTQQDKTSSDAPHLENSADCGEVEDQGATESGKLVEEHGEPFTVSDRGAVTLNQIYFVARFGKEHLILYEPTEAQFYDYDEPCGLWRPKTENTLKLNFGADLKEFADKAKQPAIINKRTETFLGGLVRLLRGHKEEPDAFAHVRRIIHVGNGMIDLESSPPVLKTFGPEYRSRNQCPIPFEANAKCPKFKQELLETALSADDISLLQRWCGSVLLGRNPAQRFLILTGTAGGGKSTILKIIEKVIGEDNCVELRTEHLTKQFEIFRFIGKTILSGKDVPGNFLEYQSAAKLKALVGGDLLTGEGKRLNKTFAVRGEFAVAITCNSRLRVKLDGDVDAWRRRLLIVEYSKPPPSKKKNNFDEILLDKEGPGILNWMLEGAIEHMRELDSSGDFTRSLSQIERTERLLAESDSLRQFCINRLRQGNGDVTTNELVEAYVDYCNDQEWRADTNAQAESQLPDLIMEMYQISKRNDIKREEKNKRGYMGLILQGKRE
jgi:P4 family phage/plasmid primase-like protien